MKSFSWAVRSVLSLLLLVTALSLVMVTTGKADWRVDAALRAYHWVEGQGWVECQYGDVLTTCTKVKVDPNGYIAWYVYPGCKNYGYEETEFAGPAKELHVGAAPCKSRQQEDNWAELWTGELREVYSPASDAVVEDGSACVGSQHCGLATHDGWAWCHPEDTGQETVMYACYQDHGGGLMSVTFWNKLESGSGAIVNAAWDCGQSSQWLMRGSWIMVWSNGSVVNGEGTPPGCGESPPPVDGACCYPAEGICRIETAQVCAATGGSYGGDDSPCEPDPCPPSLGACCFPDGHCDRMAADQCVAVGGVWQGYGMMCDPNPCPPPRMACCFPDGHCEYVLDYECFAMGGQPLGYGSVCDPNPCPQPEACCFNDDHCEFILPDICQQSGGTPRGPGSQCDPNPCRTSGIPEMPTVKTTWGRIKTLYR